LWRIGRYQWSLDNDYDRARNTLLRGLEISQGAAGVGHPTPSLLSELARLHAQRQDYAAALEFMRQFHQINSRGLGAAHPWTRDSGRRIASVPGRLGDWAAVSAELSAQREQGTSDAHSLAQELLAGTLAGETNTIPALRQELWKTVQDHPAESARYQCALILLTLVPSETELPEVLELARHAEEDKGTDWWGSFRKPLLQGLAAHRSGRFAEATEILDSLARERGVYRLVALARYFEAMALQQLGRISEAQATLREANLLLNRLLQPGNLQLASPSGESWTTLACSLVARDEAERLILGGIVSEPITQASLAINRACWAPIYQLLEDFTMAARRQDYSKAREHYLAARQNPHFSLEAAGDAVDWLVEQVPVVFAQSNDRAGFETFFRESWGDNAMLLSNDLFPVACSRWPLPEDLRDRIATRAQSFEKQQLDTTNVLEMHRHWEGRHIGLVLYAVGRYQEALPRLLKATESPDHDCATSAKTFAALAAWQLGRADEARQWRDDAEENFRIRVEAGGGVLDPRWWHLAATDLALQEARRLLGE
jgi:tetratricopeptide (TPR) repeat protein